MNTGVEYENIVAFHPGYYIVDIIYRIHMNENTWRFSGYRILKDDFMQIMRFWAVT